MAQAQYRQVAFDDLIGWATDDHHAALAAFCATAPRITDPYWQAACHLAPTSTDPRGFFELYFRPVLITDGTAPLFTGYFEPELAGSQVRDARFTHPVYGLPPDLRPGPASPTRRQIEQDGALAGRGLEIVWLDNAVDAFFLHVQGSGRVVLPDGAVLRLGFAGRNGHPYASVGQAMVARGIARAGDVTADAIRDWVSKNPDAGRELLLGNPSFIFFRIMPQLADHDGPVGALKQPLTAGRSIAVDPAFVPLGAPVWVETTDVNRLMVAQDTGSAILGAQRADLFFGTGAAAGAAAGRVADGGRMVVLMPVAVADKLPGQAA